MLKLRSDQFDIRVNLWENKEKEHISYLDSLIRSEFNAERLRYGHISGIEVGDNPEYTSFQKKHVHIAVVLFNPTSKGSMIKKYCKNAFGWYCEPRNKALPLAGWLLYHGKRKTKEQDEPDFKLQVGSLPRCSAKRHPEAMESEIDPKRQKKIEEWRRRKQLVQMEDWDTLEIEFPGFQWTTQCKNMKLELLKQKSTKWTKTLDTLDNYIIWGDSGIGKSASIEYLYPNCYKFQKGTQYWDGYDRTNPDHSVVWIDEMSRETLDTITGKVKGGFDFLKELGDRYAIQVDTKYIPGMKIRPAKIIITMNEFPTSLLPDRAYDVNCRALYRKFKILHGSEWLALNNLRLKEDKKGVEPIPDDEDGYSSTGTVDFEDYARSIATQRESNEDNQ